MKKKFLFPCLLILIFSFSNTYADENKLSFFPVVGIGKSDLEFIRKSVGIPSTEQSASFYVLNVAGVLTYRNFFINAATDIPFDDDTFYNTNPGANTNGVTTVDRDDYNFTVGYGPFDWMTLFAGYAYGKTRFTSTTNAGYGFVSDQKDRGLFGGLGFSTDIAKQGTLSFDIAYADFDGENRVRTGDPVLTAFNDRRITGPTTGYSYGLQWTAKFRQDMSYFIKLKIRNYKFEGKEANVDPQPNNLEIEKNFTMFSVGLIF